MSAKKIIGMLLVVIGIAALVWGGVFWTDTETLVDVGGLEITAQDREGFALPPVIGVLALVGGLVLLFVPERRRA